MEKYALTRNSMNAAKNKQSVQLEIGETAASAEKPQSAVQLEIAGIVDKYATAAAEVQKGTVGKIGQLTRTMAFAGALAVAPAAGMAESPYEPLAANEGGVVLVEKERVKLEREFVPLLEANGKAKYLEMYSALEPKAKDKIAKGYALIKEAGLDEKKTASGTSMLIESAMGVKNAKIIVETWTQSKKKADVETYTTAPKIKSIAKFVPRILELYDVSELEEIDRLQKTVFDEIIAQSEQRAARNRQDAAQNRQDAERYRKAAEELKKLLDKN